MKAAALGTALGLELRGDGEREVSRLASLASAGPDDVTFATGRRHLVALRATAAGLVIVPPELAQDVAGDALLSDDPYASYAKASWLFSPDRVAAPGIHPDASVAPDATIGANVSVGARAVIGSDVRLDDDVSIGAGCLIGDGVRIGARSRLFAGVTLEHDVWLGEDCRVQSGAVIGGEGFGFAPTRAGWQPIHQTGGVRIGDRVHIGANTTIDCGALEPTVIEDGVILDNQIQIGHNVRLGSNTAIAACTGVAGSTRIGANCLIGGACNIKGHIEIAAGTTITATAFVHRSILERGSFGSALPLQPNAAWRRTFALLPRLDDFVRRLRALERAVGDDARKRSEERGRPS